MKTLFAILRLIVGVLFIFSGLIKANDPMGLSYKMQEFFEIWGLGMLDPYTLAFSIIMITFEIVAGVAVLIGWQFRLFSWLLFLLIVFFTFLTGYAVFSGKIKECGCFGDCIKLTAEQSFGKDIILFLIIGFLLYKKDKIQSLLSPLLSASTILVVTIGTIWLQLHVLNDLPFIDCLPYKKGTLIPEKMKAPEGSIQDSTVINFVYLKQGKEIEFDAEHFPDDFNETDYTFVRRYDKLIRQGNAIPPIKDFVIISPSGIDTTASILSQSGRMYILFALAHKSDGHDWLSQFAKITEKAKEKGIPMIAVSSDADNLLKALQKESINIVVCKGDLVAIKTAARSNPTLYLLEQGKILDKWGRGDFDNLTVE
ncbi:MAG: BT_3928 family protein [bacterium]|jgi:uncharacterized membrane protein YphA (DoxX/SURF4 family)